MEALLLSEIMASVWSLDLAFSLIGDPSNWLLLSEIWLFLVGAFWYPFVPSQRGASLARVLLVA